MFLINDDDMSIYLTRGDTALFPVYAMKSETERYVFQPGDVVRIKVFEKKACENVVLQKDFGIEEETEFATIQLDERETKIGEVISKPKDYWYEIELNPFTEPQTIVGYDDDGAKVLKLFPEGADVPDVPIEEEDIPIVDSELDLTSTRPVSNHAVSKGFLEVKKNIEDILKITSSAGVHYEELVVVDNETASIKAISNGTNVAVMISVKLSASQVKVYNASILENRDMFEPLNIYEDTKTGILAEMITNGENHKIQFTHNRHNDYDELLLGFTNKTNSEITINHCITYPTKKTSMQEVTDARRDYKGKIYESLGEHVRALGKYSNDNCTDLHTNDDIFLKHIVLSDSEEDETLLMTGEIDRLGIVSDTLMNYAETFSNSENVSISEDGSINFNTPGIYKLNVAMTIENVYSGFDLNISLNGELFNNHFVAKQGTHTYEFDKVVLISRPTTEKLFITDMSSEYLAEITNSVLRVSEPAFIGKVSNEQIEQVVEDYLEENKIEGGATAEQLAQIEQNKKDIGKLSEQISDKATLENGVVKFYKTTTTEGEADTELFSVDLSSIGGTGGLNLENLTLSVSQNGDYQRLSMSDGTTTKYVDIPITAITDEQVQTAVETWINEHPEATTTVVDGSISESKLADDVKRRIRRTNCKIIAHRGYWATAHQNTVASFLEAIDNGFDRLEIDIRTTADGIYILAHDNGYTMYNNGVEVTGTFSTSNYSDIKNYTWDSEGLYKLNTLQAGFASMKMHDVMIICDRKAGANKDILELASLCGMSDKIMLSYGSPTNALNEKALLNRYKHIPIRVGVSTYNDMLNLMDAVSNPIYADVNASTTASYQTKAQIALACHIPMIYAGCTMDRTERWTVLANGAMASTNVSYAEMHNKLDIDYDAVATITADNDISVGVSGTYTLDASSDLETIAGYVYGYSLNPNVATVQQTVFGSTASLTITGVALGTTTIRLFTGCGAILDIPVTVSASSGGGDETKTLSSISATYIGGNVPVGTPVNSLSGITVIAHYSDGSTANVTGYTLSGTIAEGSNAITVSYSGKTTTFIVTGITESSGEFEPVIADVAYLYKVRCTNAFKVNSYANRMLVYEETGDLPFTNEILSDLNAGYGMTFYPLAIPDGATKITVNADGFKWAGFTFTSDGTFIANVSDPANADLESGATFDFSSASGAKYIGITLKNGTSNLSEDTDTSGFSVVFS